MSTDKVKPRVFVSSVIQGFQCHREAARRGIIEAGGEPVMVNEDFPSVNKSSRNACLDAVDSSDIYLVLIGERGGWTTPSGKLVVEEEYLEAINKCIPLVVFLQDVDRDDDGTRLARILSDYVDGRFRVTYEKPEDLVREVKRSLEPLTRTMQSAPFDPAVIMDAINAPVKLAEEPSIRFSIAPDRTEEIIDPMKLSDDKFIRNLYAIGHSPQIKLFDYTESKSNSHVGESLVILQSDQHNHKCCHNRVRLAIHESGLITIDTNVTGKNSVYSEVYSGNIFQLGVDDLSNSLVMCFGFAGAFFEDMDKYGRHQQFLYNVSLYNLGMRSIVETVREQQSYTVNAFRGSKDLIVAHGSPRKIGRQTVLSPNEEIKRTTLLLLRNSK